MMFKMAKTSEETQRATNVLKIQERLFNKSFRNHTMKNDEECAIEISSEANMLLTPVRFNMLGQISGKSPSSIGLVSPPLNNSASAMMELKKLNAAFIQHPAHFGFGLHQRDITPFQLQLQQHIINSQSHNNIISRGNDDSPLDFSKKKAKLENIDSIDSSGTGYDNDKKSSAESPSSRLRNILSMKTPSPSEDIVALNLAKESPNSSRCSRSDSRESSNSSPLSPSMEHPQSFVPSPRPAINPVSVAVPGGQNIFSNNGAAHYPISFSPWGNGVFSPSLSPTVNQCAAVPTGNGLPTHMEASPAIFPFQVATANTSPGAQFAPHMQLPQMSANNGTNSTLSKGRATRPFKAYPKDPMSFPTVGMYGLPLGSAPGGTEALLHQQSHQAYAEFRKQMLASSQLGRSRRGSGKNGAHHSDSSNEGLSFGGISIENMDDSSPENANSNGKSRLGKSEQQMKDEAYWERRRKNNEAAKRSRDARRAKEDEIAIRAAFLEQENLKLRFELCALKSETAKLRCMLYST